VDQQGRGHHASGNNTLYQFAGAGVTDTATNAGPDVLAMLTDTFAEPSQDKDQDNIISLEATILAAPTGGSGKLVFEDQNGKTPDAVVVKAIARASVWFEQLTAGKSRSMAEICVA
jgi:hypothetical protein